MTRTAPHAIAAQVNASQIIIRELEHFLKKTRLQRVHFAEVGVAPPMLAYVTHFPRLSVPLEGCHAMELGWNGRTHIIKPRRGHAVFVAGNGWNKPDWRVPVKVLTFLFGKKQIGVSLVRHNGSTDTPSDALKTSIHGVYDSVTQSVLGALNSFAAEEPKPPLDQLLAESLLHCCLRLLKAQPAHHSRKALRTYESICLYMQENFQGLLTREAVARRFGLAPNHVSRLFTREGSMHFNDYLNFVRINRAKFMLKNYTMTLKEISANCGFSDTAYFCRVFKRIVKMTPTEYRGR